MNQEIEQKDLQENEIISFSCGNRFYYGNVKLKEQIVILANNPNEKFRLKNISHIKRVEKGGIKQMEEEIKEEKKEKVSINEQRLNKVKRLIEFAQNELKITDRNELTKTFSRGYNYCRELQK